LKNATRNCKKLQSLKVGFS